MGIERFPLGSGCGHQPEAERPDDRRCTTDLRRQPRAWKEAYIQGVSTRAVDALLKAMGASGVSKSQVSRLCAEIDARVRAFLNRRLEGAYRYLWVDATYVKMRENGRIVSKAGDHRSRRQRRWPPPRGARHRRRSLRGRDLWTEFLRKLVRRGLKGVELVVSDAHEGFKAAVAPGTRQVPVALETDRPETPSQGLPGKGTAVDRSPAIP